MKKWFALLLSLSLCLAPCAQAQSVDYAEQFAQVSAMRPILDCLMHTIYVELNGQVGYEPNDSVFFWRTMYLIGTCFCYDDPQCTLVDDDTSVRIPRQWIEDYASTAFYAYADRSALPPLLDDDVIVYDAAFDAYVMPLSDRGEPVTEIDSYMANDDGTLRVYASLQTLDGFVFFSGAFTLVENPLLGDGFLSPFRYSIVNIEPIAL